MRFALATVRDQWPSFIGAFVALALGVALLTATLAVYMSAQPAVLDRFAGAVVVVQSPAAAEDSGFTRHVPWSPERVEALTAELAAIPGVTAAVPDRSFYAQLVRESRPLGDPPAGDPLGHAWSVAALAPYRLTAGAPPERAGEVVLDWAYGVAPGERVTLLTATGPSEYTVVGTVDGPGIYLGDSAVGQLASGVTAIGLVTGSGADPAAAAAAAREVVGTAGIVLTGDARTALEPEPHVRTRWIGTQLLSTMAVIAVFAAVFVVAATFSLGVHLRRRQLALLRTVGAVPGQVRRLMLGEALLVGLVAAVAGAVLGSALAPALGALLVRAELEPPGFTARVTALPLGVSVGTGLGVALIAVWAASRRAARIRPLAALQDAAVDRRPMTRGRWVLGCLAVAGGLGLAVATAGVDAESTITTAALSAMALMIGLALLVPALVPPVTRAVTLPLRPLRGATGLLVREYAATAVRRTAGTVAPVLVTVGFAVLLLGMVATMSPVFGDEGPEPGVEVVVAPDGTPGLSDAAVAALPGDAASVLASTVFAALPGGRPAAPLDAVGVGTAYGPDAMVVTAGTAAEHGWRPGERVWLTFPDGRTEPVRVAEMVDDDAPGPVLLSREVVRAHDPSALTGAVYVREADLAGVDQAVAGLGATAVDAATYAATDDEDRLVWIFALIMVGMSVGYTGIAVANTLMMATGGRRRDFAVLRVTGATTGQVLRVVAVETVLVVGLGTALGAAVALPALLGIRSALAESVGRPVALLLPWPELVAVVGACTVLALAASLAAGVLAMRARSGRAGAGSAPDPG